MNYQYREASLPIEQDYTTLEKIFARRGIAPGDIQHYLQTSEDDLIDPTRLDHMEEGIALLVKHISAGNQILVIVDCDADGYTSAAALINYLNHLFPYYTQNKISYRIHSGKQHGLEDQVEYILKHPEFKLIVCPDSSSNDYDYHKTLIDEGREILVLDHHDAEQYSDSAVVINNQLSQNYPTKALSGVGVVYKFCEQMDRILNTEYSNDILDLVSVGIIGDMMDIRSFEVKYIIGQGLNNVKNPFLASAVQMQDFSISKAGGLCPFSISFYIVPLINGTIRMGTIEEKLLLFEAMLDFKGYSYIPSTKRGCKGQFETVSEQACRNATNIKRHQDTYVTNDVEKIDKIIAEKGLEDNKIIAVKLKPNQLSSKNVSGLIANKLVAKYQHPFLILTEVTHEDGTITWDGSGRGCSGTALPDFRMFVKESGYSLLSEGHAGAFGCSIADSQFENFIKYSNTALANCSFEPCAKVDFVWSQNSFTSDDIIDIGMLRTVWGQNIEEPKIVIENVAVTPSNLAILARDKNPTMKITLPNGVDLIKFKVSDEEIEAVTSSSPNGCVYITILGTCALNEWNGNITGQIKISDYEITGKTEYYF